MAETPADDPGRPRSRDELDPELLRLRRSSARVGPVLCLAVIGFCVYLMIKVWPDLSFRRGGEEPKRVPSAASLVGPEGVGAEAYVAADLQPDRSFALRVPGSSGQEGHRIVPVHGTGGRLWLMVNGAPWAEPPTYHETYQGRLKELDDLPFAGSLRDHAARTRVPRWVEPRALRETLEKGAPSVRDPFGDEIEHAADTPVIVVERVRSGARLLAYLREYLPDEPAWLDALARAGVQVTGGRAVERTDKELIFEVADPGGVAAVKDKLRTAEIFNATVEPLVRRHETTWAELRAEAGGLRAGKATIAWDDLEAGALATARPVPGDAMVLVAGDRPGSYWYVWPVFIGLGLFAGLFVWALVRALRGDRDPVPESAAAAAPSSSTP